MESKKNLNDKYNKTVVYKIKSFQETNIIPYKGKDRGTKNFKSIYNFKLSETKEEINTHIDINATNESSSNLEENSNYSIRHFNSNNSFSSKASFKNSFSSYKKRLFNPFIKSSNDINNDVNKNEEMNKNCLICYEKLKNEELRDNFIGCFHIFCDDCYYNYFKEKINNNEVEKIKCPEKNCDIVIYNHFIEKKLINDIPLLDKYKKLKKRKQLMLNPDIKLCPFPDCESYALKRGNNNYVSCHNNHKFCFNCLKDWHPGHCKIERDELFEKWKNSNLVKRCPNCKYFIEKNDGCNHMTCYNCKYEWCWFCEQECKPGHYEFGGKCFGLQFSKCNFLSNRFCLTLMQISIYLLLVFAIIFLLPFAIFIAINRKLLNILDIEKNIVNTLSLLSTILIYLQ